MRILVANDDGIQANGINALVSKLSKEHEVYVIAPDRERSAAGHSLTLHTPLRVDEFEMEYPVKKAWAVTGTPGDCVKIGLSCILEEGEKPDLVISGINHGPNLGADILYSGTVSAALEGAVLGYPSIATSLCSNKSNFEDFEFAAEFITDFVSKVEKMDFPEKTILNINVPSVDKEDIAGISVCGIGTRMYTDTYEKRQDPRGKTYYWLAGELIEKDQCPNTDISAIRDNKIAITPVTFQLTHEEALPKLKEVFCENGVCDWF